MVVSESLRESECSSAELRPWQGWILQAPTAAFIASMAMWRKVWDWSRMSVARGCYNSSWEEEENAGKQDSMGEWPKAVNRTSQA